MATQRKAKMPKEDKDESSTNKKTDEPMSKPKPSAVMNGKHVKKESKGGMGLGGKLSLLTIILAASAITLHQSDVINLVSVGYTAKHGLKHARSVLTSCHCLKKASKTITTTTQTPSGIVMSTHTACYKAELHPERAKVELAVGSDVHVEVIHHDEETVTENGQIIVNGEVFEASPYRVAPGNWDYDDQICSIGSACYPDRQKYGPDGMWPEESEELRTNRLHQEKQRLWFNLKQPQAVPRLTKMGYEARRVPDDAFKALKEWWDNNKHHQTTEAWPIENIYVNHWDVASTMAYVPEYIRDTLHESLKPIMEEWSKLDLTLTSIYGIRSYQNGSILANHIDQGATHVVSGIINVEQEVDEPWGLFVQGHDNVKREVFIKPGDLLLYESAKVIHGRPTPFKGKFYANIFVHFMPVDNWHVDMSQFEI